MIPTRHKKEIHLTIDELQLELEILKEKHGKTAETNISEVLWVNPKKGDTRKSFACLINPKYVEISLR